MRYIFFVLIVLSVNTQLTFAGNFILTINNKPYDLSLGEEEKIKVGDQYFSVKIEQKDILTYKTDNFTYKYHSKYSPSRSDLGEGIFQTTMMTPLGTLVMVQEYQTMDPSSLIDLMVNEITKEEKEYGYKIESAPNSITLSDGKKLIGKVITSKYKGTDIKRHLYVYGVKDEGLLILTQIDYDMASSDKEVIEMFINSLTIKMK